MKRYTNVNLDYGVNAEIMAEFERQQAEEKARAEAEEKAFLEAEKEADDADSDISDGNDGGYDDVLPEELDAVIDAMAGGAEKTAEADDADDVPQADAEPQDIVELD